jgi:hypothetical protein
MITFEKLPDFDDLVSLAQEIGKLKTELMKHKSRLEELKARITFTVTSEAAYFVSGKVPSMAHIEALYHVVGYDEECRLKLFALKESIANEEGLLREKELTFQVYRDMIDVWRTESANKRGAFFEG